MYRKIIFTLAFIFLLFPQRLIASSPDTRELELPLSTHSVDNNFYITSLSQIFDPKETDMLLFVNGKVIVSTQNKPFIHEGTTMVPLRIISEALDATVNWDDKTKEITIEKENDIIVLTIGSDKAFVNGIEKPLMKLPMITSSNYTYVPLRFVSENMGCYVDYDDKTFSFYEEMRELYDNIDSNKQGIPIISVVDGKYVTNWRFETSINESSESFKVKSFGGLTQVHNKKFILNNFPEGVLSNSFYETYINKTELKSDNARILVSHFNHSKKSIDYVIRFENNSDNFAGLTYVEDAHVQKEDEPYTDIGVRASNLAFYEKLAKDKYVTQSIAPNSYYDYVIPSIGDDTFFSALLDVNIIGEITVTAFVVESGNDIGTVETPTIPYDFDYIPKSYIPSPEGQSDAYKYYTVYSGMGTASKIETETTIDASSLENNNNAISFETGATSYNLNEKMGLKEVVEIELHQPKGINNEITKAQWVMNLPYTDETGSYLRDRPRNYGNLGNWGVEYEINTTLHNDSAVAKTFNLRLITPHQSTMAILANNTINIVNHNNRSSFDTIKRETFDNYTDITLGENVKNWNVLSCTLPPHSKKKISYTYILGTDCNADVFHLWELTK